MASCPQQGLVLPPCETQCPLLSDTLQLCLTEVACDRLPSAMSPRLPV